MQCEEVTDGTNNLSIHSVIGFKNLNQTVALLYKLWHKFCILKIGYDDASEIVHELPLVTLWPCHTKCLRGHGLNGIAVRLETFR